MLPKSRLSATAIICILFLSACADKIKTDLNAYEALDEGLTSSNKSIDNCTSFVFHVIQNKLAEPSMADRARIWMPKAAMARELSKSIILYIEGLKSALKEEAGGQSLRKGDKIPVMRVFEKRKKGVELYQHLKKYRDDMMAIDPEIARVFDPGFVLITASFDSTSDQEKNFTKTFFDDIPVTAALAMLSKFENNVKIIEFRTIEFCNNMVGSVRN